MAASDEWRWTDDQGVQRIVRTDELRSALASSVLPPSTLVWREGMTDWVPAFTVPELGATSQIADPQTDGPTDVNPAPRARAADRGESAREGGHRPVSQPALVVSGRMIPGAHPASAVETGRPTPTEILKATGQERAASPNEGAPPAAEPLKIGAAPRPLPPGAPRPAAAKLESATSVSKVGIPRPVGATTAVGGWRKPDPARSKSDEDVTLVADADDAFKVKRPVDPGANGGAPAAAPRPTFAAVPAGATSVDAPKDAGRVAQSLTSRRAVTRTGLASPAEQARPEIAKSEPAKPAGPPPRPPSNAPAAPVRRLASVPPPPVQVGPRRSPSAGPPPLPNAAPADPKGFRTTAFMGSSRPSSAPPRPGSAGPLAVPSAPRVPKVEKPAFNVVENTSTDSTGVLPLGGKYAAEPNPPERPGSPSFVDAAPAFAERTPSFPDGGQPTAGRGASLGSYPPAPQPIGVSAAASGASAAAPAPAASAAAPPGFEPMPYSAPPPPLALIEPSIGEIRATGALPLVNPKRTTQPASTPPPPYGSTPPPPYGSTPPPHPSQAPPPYASQPPPPLTSTPPPPLTSTPPPPLTSQPPPAIDDRRSKPPGKGEAVVVPLSSLFGAGAMLIGMAIMAFFMGRCSVAGASSAPPARAALAALPRLARAALPSPPKPCWMAKQPVRWAPAVVQSVAVDVAPTANGVVVAYARDPREPATVEVDFANGTFTDKPAEKRDGDLVRVFAPRDGAGLLATTKSDAGPLAPYVFAPGASPFVIGVAGRGTPDLSVGAADKPDAAPASLWTLPAVEDEKGLDAARVLATGPASYALVFRRSGSILGGFIGDGRKAEGSLAVVAGSGGSVGKPSLGTNKREVAVVFGDRAGSDSPWEIRVGHAPLPQMPRETTVVPLPRGGPGGDAFAPDVAGIADGRWVLVWTEGKTGAYAVRAQTFGADFKPLGDPIAISPPAGNFGQAVVGVAGNYVTTMFLSRAPSGSYELWGAVLQCGS